MQSNIDKEFCGKYASRQSLNVAFKEYTDINGGTVHMTLIFNVFVIYTLFNQINCRMIDDSFNIFKRIQNSLLFPLITLVEMGLQVLIVIFGGSVFHVSSNGLTGEQWGICIGFSAITFVVSVLAKLLPLEKLIDSNKVEADEDKTVDIKIRQNEEFGATDESFLGVRVHKKRKLYDQAIANDEKRVREDKDVLKLSENSSLNIPRVKEQ